MSGEENKVLGRFLDDIRNHSIDIQKDDGVFRHIRFSKGGSSAYCFFLTTWPGFLCISGDMGCYVFRRTNDMFTFFRGDDLSINLGYWTEKLESISKFGAEDGRISEFDAERTRELILEDLDDLIDIRDRDWFTEELKYCDTEQDFLSLLDRRDISDAWEFLCRKPTFHIQWCLYAIRWGIQMYDKTKGTRKL